MAKWADYLISGVWFIKTADSRRISHVMLHEDNDATISIGKKTIEAEVLKLLKAQKSVLTIVWDYASGTWTKGEQVGYETLSNRQEILRTHRNGVVSDNLDNLINMGFFYSNLQA